MSCRLYVNGELAGQIVSGQTYIGSDGSRKNIEGGGPMNLDQPIRLCNNEDNDPERHFDGFIAYLGERT